MSMSTGLWSVFGLDFGLFAGPDGPQEMGLRSGFLPQALRLPDRTGGPHIGQQPGPDGPASGTTG